MTSPPPLLIDDFSEPDGRSASGGSWQAFTDGVMGGLSRMDARLVDEQGRRHVRMTGEVRLENNGGFVQIALTLTTDGRDLDATAYRAIRLRVRGNGARYYVHLRTDDTRAPWQYYAASFPTTPEWTDVEVEFSRFEPASLRAPLDRSRLRRIGLVAAKRAMQADLAVERIELVP